MKQNILYVGLDADDTQYHASAFNKDTGEVIDVLVITSQDGEQLCYVYMQGLKAEMAGNNRPTELASRTSGNA